MQQTPWRRFFLVLVTAQLPSTEDDAAPELIQKNRLTLKRTLRTHRKRDSQGPRDPVPMLLKLIRVHRLGQDLRVSTSWPGLQED